MALDNILQMLGADEPFDKNGELTQAGIEAVRKLVKIVDGLECIGAAGKTGDKLEDYIYDIVRLGY